MDPGFDQFSPVLIEDTLELECLRRCVGIHDTTSTSYLVHTVPPTIFSMRLVLYLQM